MRQKFTDIEHEQRKNTTKREAFRDIMDGIIPWAEWTALIRPCHPKGLRGRPPAGIGRMPRMCLLQIFLGLSDPGTVDAISDSCAMRKFVGVGFLADSVPEETTLRRFRHLIEESGRNEEFFHLLNGMLEDQGLMWRGGTIADGTIIEFTSSTRNRKKGRDPETRQTRKGSQRHHGMKTRVGVDAGTGPAHSATSAAASAADMTEATKGQVCPFVRMALNAGPDRSPEGRPGQIPAGWFRYRTCLLAKSRLFESSNQRFARNMLSCRLPVDTCPRP